MAGRRSRRAIREMRKLPPQVASEIRTNLDLLAADPYRMDLELTKLRGRPGFRMRHRAWRVIYEINEKEIKILVLRVAHRKEIYK